MVVGRTPSSTWPKSSGWDFANLSRLRRRLALWWVFYNISNLHRLNFLTNRAWRLEFFDAATSTGT
jgi:hypothetical protein